MSDESRQICFFVTITYGKDIVTERIINNKEVLRMTRLTNTLNDMLEKKGLTCPWPPTSVDLTTDAVRSVVPAVLFNFLAWAVGASEDPLR
ncbi:uncharacterized protein LOC130013141 [Patella vulgata]|uniref:uncharacterized protein LOC130013141 n=1 Tax=Patella vulgata TaxID=6465 RepID=UPI0024A99999|nr:uncharacterized protein LOC130013141 [Patella vulgata]